jgi:hypothetical protein
MNRVYRKGPKPPAGKDTPWIGFIDKKLYLQSGQFSSTLRTSRALTSINSQPSGVGWSGTDTMWCGFQTGNHKLYLQSGQFASTIKSSVSVGAIDTIPSGISREGNNTLWCGVQAGKFYKNSGIISTTLKSSVAAVDPGINGLSWDNVAKNLVATGDTINILFAQRGFTTTFIKFLSVGSVDLGPGGDAWDGQNGVWSGYGDRKLYLQSGQWSTTLKTSQSISSIDTPFGCSTNDFEGVMGLIPPSTEDARVARQRRLPKRAKLKRLNTVEETHGLR